MTLERTSIDLSHGRVSVSYVCAEHGHRGTQDACFGRARGDRLGESNIVMFRNERLGVGGAGRTVRPSGQTAVS